MKCCCRLSIDPRRTGNEFQRDFHGTGFEFINQIDLPQFAVLFVNGGWVLKNGRRKKAG